MRVSNRAILSLTRLSATIAAVMASATLCFPGCRPTEEAADPASTRPAEKGDITITIVYDNNPGAQGLTAAWGFACVVQGPERTVLFDTGGDGEILLGNMRHLGIEPSQIDAVVLSHIHGDHTGGLSSFLKARGGVPVYVPSGFPAAFLERVRSLGGRPVESGRSRVVCPGIRTTGTLGRGAIEEQGLCVQIRNGWALITGCAHPGVANMAAKAKEVTNGPIRVAMGGFHMSHQTKQEIAATIDRLEELGVEQVAPCHCSGDTARELFKQRFGDRCVLACVGSALPYRSKR